MIIICGVTYNRKPLVEQWLTSLFRNFPKNAILYIADNGSKDGTCDLLRDVEKDVRVGQVIYNGKNLGKAKAFNILFDISTKKYPQGKYIVSSDSDIGVSAGWHTKLLEVFEDFKDDTAQLGWVSPIYESSNNPIPHNVDDILEMAEKYKGKLIDNISCPGGFIMFPVSMYKKAGGYCIDNVYGGIDGSYLHHCRKHGFRCGFTPRCVVKHIKGGPEYDNYEKWKREKQTQLKKHGVFNYKITKGFWD